MREGGAAILAKEADMRAMGKWLVRFSLALLIGGCGGKSLVVLVPDPDGHVGQVVVANAGGQQVLDQANQAVYVLDRQTPPGQPTIVRVEDINADFAEVLAAQPLPPAKFVLYFLQGSNELTGESQGVLKQIIHSIQQRGSTDIVISGHTDRVGDDAYNYKLALDRAQVTAEILAASGAEPANIRVTSHGEGNPLITTDDNVMEPRNRRVEVVIR